MPIAIIMTNKHINKGSRMEVFFFTVECKGWLINAGKNIALQPS